MPIVFINMLEGKTPEQKINLVSEITETINKTIDIPKDKITIFINEYEKCSVARNGIMYSNIE